VVIRRVARLVREHAWMRLDCWPCGLPPK
jgi:hypothetical protein